MPSREFTSFLTTRLQLTLTLFPCTTLFRSSSCARIVSVAGLSDAEHTRTSESGDNGVVEISPKLKSNRDRASLTLPVPVAYPDAVAVICTVPLLAKLYA